MHNMLKAYETYRKADPKDSQNEKIQEYAQLVYRVVRQVGEKIPPTVDREDLFSAGMVGLLDALSKFNPDRGIAFEAYARIRVRGSILDELRNLDHLTRRMRSRAKSVSDSIKKIEKETGEPVSQADVAADTGMSISEVQESVAKHTPPAVVDPSTMDMMDLPTLWNQPLNALEKLEKNERVRLLSKALANLPERNRLVVGMYYEAEMTLNEIGQVLGVTESRASQILRKTAELLRDEIMEKIA